MKAVRQSLWVAFVTVLFSVAGAELYGADYYVNGTAGVDSPSRGSKAQPWKTINYALGHITGAAGTPHKVLVAGGNYAENVVVGPYESIYGGYDPATWAREPNTNPTTIRAPSAGSVVVLGEQSIVDGFTLRNGNRDYGGGVYCQNVSATIANCHIVQNQATQDGSAIYVKAGDVNIVSNTVEQNTNVPRTFSGAGCAILIDGGSATLRDNVIQDNASGWAICGRDAKVQLQGDRILRNQGYGIYTERGTLTASDCVVCENSRTGIFMYKGSLHQCIVCRNNTGGSQPSGIESWEGVQIDGCVVCQGRSQAAAIYGKVDLSNSIVVSNRSSDPYLSTKQGCEFWDGTTLSNNLFVNNERTTIGDSLTSTNNTFVMNTCGYYAGGYGWSPADIRITNDILWDNDDDMAVGRLQFGPPNVTYCNISDGDFNGSNGNVSVNPDFVGQVGAGTMSHVKYDRQNCRTTVTHSGANYRPGALARTFLWTSDTAFYVETNNTTEITVYGDITQVASAGFKYTIIDYRLQPSSLCVDAGTNVGAPDHDFESDPRPLLGRTSETADIGADEYNPKGQARCRTFPVGDLNEDCVVDLRDLAILLSHWLESSIQE